MTLRLSFSGLTFTVAALVACLRAGTDSEETISARALLTRIQGVSGANYTFDRVTSEAMTVSEVPELPDSARQDELESALREAGFQLRRLDITGKEVFVVENVGG